jgi:hypothetical protein
LHGFFLINNVAIVSSDDYASRSHGADRREHAREVFLQTYVLFGMVNCVIQIIPCIENCTVVKRLKTWSSKTPHESNIDISSNIRPNDSLSSEART